MQYFTIVAETYEKAVEEARRKWGDDVRVHSRRDFTQGGGLFARKRKRCEITCYLAPSAKTAPKRRREADEPTVSGQDLAEFEKEARTPDPGKLTSSEMLDTLKPGEEVRAEADKAKAAAILDENDIHGPLREKVLDGFSAGGDLFLTLADRIVSAVPIDHDNQARPKRHQVFIGPTGSGKTTTLAKVAALYRDVGRSVGIITLDSYRVGAWEQVKAFADALGLPAVKVSAEDEVLTAKDRLAAVDYILVDTMGLSPADTGLNLKLRGILSLFDDRDTSYLLTCPANIKTSDMMAQWRHYTEFKNVTSLVATKLDETSSIGSFLSFAYEVGAPVSFCCDGQGVPEDLKKASSVVFMRYLSGLDVDLRGLAGQLNS